MISCLMGCNGNGTGISQKKLFDLNWKFNYGNNKSSAEVDFMDQNWRSLDLPHDWSKDKELLRSINGTTNSNPLKIAWYRKHFEIPENWFNKNISIYFEGISDQTEIFVNGKSIDHFHEKSESYQKLISPYLNYKDNNVIAIKVSISKQTEGRSEAYLGIYKHVWLVIKDSQGSIMD